MGPAKQDSSYSVSDRTVRSRDRQHCLIVVAGPRLREPVSPRHGTHGLACARLSVLVVPGVSLFRSIDAHQLLCRDAAERTFFGRGGISTLRNRAACGGSSGCRGHSMGLGVFAGWRSHAIRMDLGHVSFCLTCRQLGLAHTAYSRIAKTIFVDCLRLSVGVCAADEPSFRYRLAVSFRVGRRPRRLRIESIVGHAAYLASVDYSLLPSMDAP